MSKPGMASQFIGVHRTKYAGRPWTAQIRIGGSKRGCLGAWRTESEAAEAYDRAALHYRGKDGLRNFPRRRLRPADAASLQIEAWQRFKILTTSRYRGVVADHPSWRAQIRPTRGPIHLGHWKIEREAAEAYDRAARFFSFDRRHLNFPQRPLPAASPEELRRRARASRKTGRATSPYRGVFLSSRSGWRPWTAQITVDGQRTRHLGTWATEKDAARAFDRAAKFYLGAAAELNLPAEQAAPASAPTLISEARREGKLARSSRYLGVSWATAQAGWRAQIQHHSRNFRIGVFSMEVEAAKAYDSRAIALRGLRARVNFHPETGRVVWGKRLIDL